MHILALSCLRAAVLTGSWSPYLSVVPDNSRCLAISMRFDLSQYAAAWCDSPVGKMEWRPFYQDTAASDSFAIGSNSTRMCFVESASAMGELAGAVTVDCYAVPHGGVADARKMRVAWQPLQPALAQLGHIVPPSMAVFAVNWSPESEPLQPLRLRFDKDGCLRLQASTFCVNHGRLGPLPRENGLGGLRGVALHADLREVRRQEVEEAPPRDNTMRRTRLRDVGARMSRIARHVRKLSGREQ